MGFFRNIFPYSNMHELNLDWIIKELNDLRSSLDASIQPDRIVKNIYDDNGNFKYRFEVNSSGMFFYEPNSTSFKFGFLWSGNELRLTGALSAYGKVSAARRYFMTNTDSNNQRYDAGVIEVTAEGNQIRFWSKTDPSNPSGIEHYSLPPATATTATYYDILTTKDLYNSPVNSDIPFTRASCSGSLVLRRWRNVITLRVDNLVDTNFANAATLALITNTEYRPAANISAAVQAPDGSVALIQVTTNGQIQLLNGASDKHYYGSLTYIPF